MDKYSRFGKAQRSGKVFGIKKKEITSKLLTMSEGGRVINYKTGERKRI